MGHIHPQNIAEHLFNRLFQNLWDSEGMIDIFGESHCYGKLLDFPIELTIEDEIKHLQMKADALQKVLDTLEPKTMEYILVNKAKDDYGVQCSDGVYFETELYHDSMQIILDYWTKIGLTLKADNGWHLDWTEVSLRSDKKDTITELFILNQDIEM